MLTAAIEFGWVTPTVSKTVINRFTTMSQLPSMDMATSAALGIVESVALALLESPGHHWESCGPCSWPDPRERLPVQWLNLDSPVTVSKIKRCVFNRSPSPGPRRLLCTCALNATGTSDGHSCLFSACSLLSSEALQPKSLEPYFSETARKRWWDWTALWDKSCRKKISDMRAGGSSGRDGNAVGILAGRKGEEHKHGGCPPGPHLLGRLTTGN